MNASNQPPKPLAVAYVIADYLGGVPEDYTVLVARILSVVEGDQRIAELESALAIAVTALSAMVDPETGVLRWLKQQGEQQGVSVTATYDAVLELIAVLQETLGGVTVAGDGERA